MAKPVPFATSLGSFKTKMKIYIKYINIFQGTLASKKSVVMHGLGHSKRLENAQTQ